MWWWNHFAHTEDGIPRADDLNFYYPWVQDFLANPSFKKFVEPHGGYSHFLYKTISIINYKFLDYDLRYYFCLSPLVLILTSVILLKSVSLFENWKSILLSFILVIMIFSPARMGQMSYDMISFQGNINFLAIFFLMISTEQLLNAKFSSKNTFNFLLSALLAILLSVSALTKVFLVPLIVAIIFNFARLFFLKQASYKLFLKYLSVMIILFIVFVTEDLLITSAGHVPAASTFGIDLSTSFIAVKSGAFNAFIGPIFVNVVDFMEQNKLMGWALFALYCGGVSYLSLRLISKGKVFALALIGAPILFSIVGYNLRGSLNWPRYQGVLLIFPLGIIYGILCLQSTSDNSDAKKYNPVLISTSGCVAVLLAWLLIRNVYLANHYSYIAGSKWKYYQSSRVEFLEPGPLDPLSLKSFSCNLGQKKCTEIINDIRGMQGIDQK